ncbi:archaellin/type IV pilin N-terminal domain-containing protein [Halovivax gelatinilyticus]|uniref:archaellin/type IV pilin N-terminal domain-containing protein n=1 Tax=Halovivax gelatinilyticus TaxID=2961597 RepID=UPI0020CA60BD|nr:archaellin/type IV pilin N-terminal domain-containing protein [Halovivax gelatinilyticus]
MFETIHSEDERGQVGIGTLIVFIAMVLVAAIAAGVLINTAGSLQSQASDTGTETQQAVANQIEVVHAYGDTNADIAADGSVNTAASHVEQINLVVKKSAGSDVIDLNSMTVQYTSDSVSETLELGDGFDSTELTSGTESDALVSTDDRIEIHIDLSSADNSAFDEDQHLDPGDSATVELVDQSGAQFSYGVTVPATFADDAAVVVV